MNLGVSKRFWTLRYISSMARWQWRYTIIGKSFKYTGYNYRQAYTIVVLVIIFVISFVFLFIDVFAVILAVIDEGNDCVCLLSVVTLFTMISVLSKQIATSIFFNVAFSTKFKEIIQNRRLIVQDIYIVTCMMVSTMTMREWQHIVRYVR